MRITGLRLYSYTLPLDPPPEIKGKPLHNREGILLQLTGDGIEGWGEASPLPGFSRESLEEVTQQMWNVKPALMALDPTDWPDDSLQSVLDSFDLAPSVRFGVELATANLHAAARKKTLPEVLGETGKGGEPERPALRPRRRCLERGTQDEPGGIPGRSS